MTIKKSSSRKLAPIGIFDSGVGGLTVVRAVQQQLPAESFVYLGDTARTPYGSKAKETVRRFSQECADYLSHYRIKALVVACNTASANALSLLRSRLSIPVLGVIQPGARAALRPPNGFPIGVIGTKSTVNSQAYLKALVHLNPRAEAVSAACPLLVPLVEEGWLDHPVTRTVIQTYLNPLLARKITSLILGCTHYPALKHLFAEACGPDVRLIDSAEEIALELKQTLGKLNLLNPGRRAGRQTFLVTDVPEQFIRVGEYLLGRKLNSVKRVLLTEAPRHV
jgi:glutamate racemase